MEEKIGVNGIGTAGYPATGYTARKAERNVEFGAVGFMETVVEKAVQAAGEATATLHGDAEESGDIAVSSWADVVSGSSISVYKSQDFDPENPIYKVKTWDKSGNVTEQMVDLEWRKSIGLNMRSIFL